MVGQADGRIKLFLNVETDSEPSFDAGSFLQVGPAGSKTDINVGKRATLTIEDWNSDGRKDLVAGALDGKIHLFLNEGTDASPDFLTTIYAQASGSDLVVPGTRSSPAVIDADRDGRKDLVSGNTEGQLVIYCNNGTESAPSFATCTFAEAGGTQIDLPDAARSRPFVCDWTNDGLVDVLIGTMDGKVHLYQGDPQHHVLRRSGNVNAGIGQRSDVLFINNSVGNYSRLYSTSTGKPVALTMKAPVAGPNPADYVVYWIWWEPGVGDMVEHPIGIGTSCIPMPLGNGSITPPPLTLVNTIGHNGLLGNPMLSGISPAPGTLFSVPQLPPGTYAFQGYIIDSGSSSSSGVSLTNAIVLKVQ